MNRTAPTRGSRCTPRVRAIRLMLLTLFAPFMGCSDKWAPDPAEEVVRAGDMALTMEELMRELESEPAFVRKRFNKDKQSKKQYVEARLRDKALLDEARRRRLDEDAQVRRRYQRLLIDRLTEILRQEASEQALRDEEISRYLDEHRATLEPEPMVRVGQIVVSRKEEAVELSQRISAAAGDRVTEFRAAARQHSLDRETGERDGDMGYITPRRGGVAPVVVAAALALAKVGDLSPPILLDGRWVLVMRTGDPPGKSVSPEDLRRMAQQRLRLELRRDAQENLLQRLYQQKKPEVAMHTLERIKVEEEDRDPAEEASP